MKKEKILTLKIAKELLASFLSEKESLPPLPSLPLFGEGDPHIALAPPPQEQESIEFEKKTKREMFLVHGVFASLRQSEREYIKCLPQFGWRISGTAMPDLTPFTQIETDAIGLLREAIVNGVNLWGSPLLYEFLIEPTDMDTHFRRGSSNAGTNCRKMGQSQRGVEGSFVDSLNCSFIESAYVTCVYFI
ncbi:MAG TPA: hypothetical protein DCX14_03530 [Flavobacteriales bacterium]|nr:hypothetical protein [Flavobacteriales bacterium]